MTLILAQKYMNLSRSIALSSISFIALSGSGLSATAAETQPANKTFGDWCRDRASLSPETKHTVEVLLQKAGTNECDAADRKLSSLTELELSEKSIEDVKPLASLTKLTHIYLSGNPIDPKTCPLKPESICNWEPIPKS